VTLTGGALLSVREREGGSGGGPARLNWARLGRGGKKRREGSAGPRGPEAELGRGGKGRERWAAGGFGLEG
jgi:hypothetical protein